MKEFDFFQFSRLGETLEFVRKQKHTLKILAGGTDLIIELRKNSPKLGEYMDKVVDITNLNELKSIDDEGDYIDIGACVTHSEIASSEIIKKHFPALAQASASVGCLQTRNVGTIGGNIVNASPSADTIPALTAYNAELVLVKDHGEERTVKINDFINGPYKTVIKKDEILASVILKKTGYLQQKAVFEKLGRRNALSITRISVCAVAELDKNIIKNINIVPGAVLSKFRNIDKAQNFLIGKKPEKDILKQAASIVSSDVFEEVGQRWSTPYKQPVLEKMVYSALCKMFDIKLN